MCNNRMYYYEKKNYQQKLMLLHLESSKLYIGKQKIHLLEIPRDFYTQPYYAKFVNMFFTIISLQLCPLNRLLLLARCFKRNNGMEGK